MEQACYKPQIRPDEEGEEVGPMVGPTGICDGWRSIIHDKRGISSGLGTGIMVSEMTLDGAARRSGSTLLYPGHWLKKLDCTLMKSLELVNNQRVLDGIPCSW